MQIIGNRTQKSRFTRMCIGQAVIALLKESTLHSLKVSSVVLKAGVSRVTFYKYYGNLRAALQDYLHIIIAEYIEECTLGNEWSLFLTYEHILSALKFFDRYRSFFMTMMHHGLYSVLIESVNDFVTTHIPNTKKISLYKRYSYAGSLLNCFIMWQQNGKKESAEEIAQTIYELYGTT